MIWGQLLLGNTIIPDLSLHPNLTSSIPSSALASEPEQRWQPSKHLETDSRRQGKVAMRTTSQSGHRHYDICVGCQGFLSLQCLCHFPLGHYCHHDKCVSLEYLPSLANIPGLFQFSSMASSLSCDHQAPILETKQEESVSSFEEILVGPVQPTIQ